MSDLPPLPPAPGESLEATANGPRRTINGGLSGRVKNPGIPGSSSFVAGLKPSDPSSAAAHRRLSAGTESSSSSLPALRGRIDSTFSNNSSSFDTQPPPADRPGTARPHSSANLHPHLEGSILQDRSNSLVGPLGTSSGPTTPLNLSSTARGLTSVDTAAPFGETRDSGRMSQHSMTPIIGDDSPETSQQVELEESLPAPEGSESAVALLTGDLAPTRSNQIDVQSKGPENIRPQSSSQSERRELQEGQFTIRSGKKQSILLAVFMSLILLGILIVQVVNITQLRQMSKDQDSNQEVSAAVCPLTSAEVEGFSQTKSDLSELQWASWIIVGLVMCEGILLLVAGVLFQKIRSYYRNLELAPPETDEATAATTDLPGSRSHNESVPAKNPLVGPSGLVNDQGLGSPSKPPLMPSTGSGRRASTGRGEARGNSWRVAGARRDSAQTDEDLVRIESNLSHSNPNSKSKRSTHSQSSPSQAGLRAAANLAGSLDDDVVMATPDTSEGRGGSNQLVRQSVNTESDMLTTEDDGLSTMANSREVGSEGFFGVKKGSIVIVKFFGASPGRAQGSLPFGSNGSVGEGNSQESKILPITAMFAAVLRLLQDLRERLPNFRENIAVVKDVDGFIFHTRKEPVYALRFAAKILDALQALYAQNDMDPFCHLNAGRADRLTVLSLGSSGSNYQPSSSAVSGLPYAVVAAHGSYREHLIEATRLPSGDVVQETRNLALLAAQISAPFVTNAAFAVAISESMNSVLAPEHAPIAQDSSRSPPTPGFGSTLPPNAKKEDLIKDIILPEPVDFFCRPVDVVRKEENLYQHSNPSQSHSPRANSTSFKQNSGDPQLPTNGAPPLGNSLGHIPSTSSLGQSYDARDRAGDQGGSIGSVFEWVYEVLLFPSLQYYGPSLGPPNHGARPSLLVEGREEGDRSPEALAATLEHGQRPPGDALQLDSSHQDAQRNSERENSIGLSEEARTKYEDMFQAFLLGHLGHVTSLANEFVRHYPGCVQTPRLINYLRFVKPTSHHLIVRHPYHRRERKVWEALDSKLSARAGMTKGRADSVSQGLQAANQIPYSLPPALGGNGSFSRGNFAPSNSIGGGGEFGRGVSFSDFSHGAGGGGFMSGPGNITSIGGAPNMGGQSYKSMKFAASKSYVFNAMHPRGHTDHFAHQLNKVTRQYMAAAVTGDEDGLMSADSFDDLDDSLQEPNLSTGPPTSAKKVSARLEVKLKDNKERAWRRSPTVLGSGQSGTVYMALREADGYMGALKAVPVDKIADNENAQKQLTGEVAVLSRLKHPNLVDYLGFAVTDHHICLFMEYISGGSLSSITEAFGGLPESTCKRYARDLCQGLAYLHNKDIIHRDMKPQNVLVTLDGVCKITDFGTVIKSSATNSLLMKSQSAALGVVTSGSNPLMMSAGGGGHTPSQSQSGLLPETSLQGELLSQDQGIAAGSPLFMAPEQARAEAVQVSDIWSLGLTIYFMFTGVLPYPEDQLYLPPLAFMYQLGSNDEFVPILEDDEEIEGGEGGGNSNNTNNNFHNFDIQSNDGGSNPFKSPKNSERSSSLDEHKDDAGQSEGETQVPLQVLKIETGPTGTARSSNASCSTPQEAEEGNSKPKLSKPMKDFLTKCFHRNPKDRATAHELLSHPWIAELSARVGKTAAASARDAAAASQLQSPVTRIRRKSDYALRGLRGNSFAVDSGTASPAPGGGTTAPSTPAQKLHTPGSVVTLLPFPEEGELSPGGRTNTSAMIEENSLTSSNAGVGRPLEINTTAINESSDAIHKADSSSSPTTAAFANVSV